MFSGNIYYRGNKKAAELELPEVTQLANLADAKKNYLGVTNFREQYVLSSGATVDIVINEHHSFINIVGFGEVVTGQAVRVVEETFEARAIFRLIPYADYPQAIVYVDEESPDGISLYFDEDLRAGNAYSHFPDSEELISFSTDGRYTTFGSSQENFYARREVYQGGYLLLEPTEDTIGAFIVSGVDGEPDMYCIVVHTGTTVELYSALVIEIDYSSTDYTTPILDFADFIKVRTTTLTRYTYDNSYDTTICTANKNGSKAVLGAFNGNTSTHRKQHIFSYALEVVDGELEVVETEEVNDVSYTATNVYSPMPSPLGATTTTYIDVPYNNTLSGVDIRENTYEYYTDDMEAEYDSDAADSEDVLFGVQMSAEGAPLYAATNRETTFHENGRGTGTYRTESGAGTFVYGNTEQGGSASIGAMATVLSAMATSALPMIGNYRPLGPGYAWDAGFPIQQKNGLYSHEDSDVVTYTIGNYHTKTQTNGITTTRATTSYGGAFSRSDGFGGWENVFDEYRVGDKEHFVSDPPDPDPNYLYNFNPAIWDTLDPWDAFVYTNIATAERDIEEYKPLVFDARIQVGFYYNYSVNKVSYTQRNDWESYDVPAGTREVTRYVSMVTPTGEVAIPGLPSFIGTSYEPAPGTPGSYAFDYFSASDKSSSTTTTRSTPTYVTTYTVNACFHPLGYVMYSLNDHPLQSEQDTYNSSTSDITVVLGVHTVKTGRFVNLIDMYNAELVATESELEPLKAVFPEGDTAQLYGHMGEYGLLNIIQDIKTTYTETIDDAGA